jgi:hypothetical protein
MAKSDSRQRYQRWTTTESKIMDRYIAALVARRYRRLQDAVDAFVQEVDRQRERRPDAGWPPVPRPRSAVGWRLRERAKSAGWVSLRVHWDRAETAVLARYVRALMEGRFRDTWSAARACLRALARLRRPGAAVCRTPKAVRDRLVLLARRLGWSQSATRWLPQERRVLARYVRALVIGRYASAALAAKECAAELDQLHRRLRRESGARGFFPRKVGTIANYLHRWSRDRGRPVAADWTEAEVRVIRRHAQRLASGEHGDGRAAAQACLLDLQALRRRQWRLFRHIRPRAKTSVSRQLRVFAHETGERWPKSAWSIEELRACQRWLRWYERHRRARRLRPWATAAEGLQQELEQMHSRRSIEACAARIWKERRRRLGLA